MTALDYEKIARSHHSLARGRVWCRTCNREQAVDAAASLRSGWPKCCGFTMTIDHPSTWSPTHDR
ncbi:MAG: hypothetical protein LCH88_08945 [Proteobacteria bacterium]|nr:hypothetical protein [Pseudomonadota bacterium]